MYFSDNGSTAIEIALKMALRKFLFDHRIISDDLVAESAESRVELKVGLLHFLQVVVLCLPVDLIMLIIKLSINESFLLFTNLIATISNINHMHWKMLVYVWSFLS